MLKVTQEIKLEKDALLSFKLPSGEEVMGKVVEFDESTVTLRKPYMLVQTHDGIGVAPASAMAGQDASIVLLKSAIVFYTSVLDDFANAYHNATSPIMTPSSGIVS